MLTTSLKHNQQLFFEIFLLIWLDLLIATELANNFTITDREIDGLKNQTTFKIIKASVQESIEIIANFNLKQSSLLFVYLIFQQKFLVLKTTTVYIISYCA